MKSTSCTEEDSTSSGQCDCDGPPCPDVMPCYNDTRKYEYYDALTIRYLRDRAKEVERVLPNDARCERCCRILSCCRCDEGDDCPLEGMRNPITCDGALDVIDRGYKDFIYDNALKVTRLPPKIPERKKMDDKNGNLVIVPECMRNKKVSDIIVLIRLKLMAP